MERTLYRARKGRWLAGVCAGMAEYMNLPVAVVRCILVGMTFFFFGGIFVYIASVIMIPWEPETPAEEADETEATEETETTEQTEE